MGYRRNYLGKLEYFPDDEYSNGRFDINNKQVSFVPESQGGFVGPSSGYLQRNWRGQLDFIPTEAENEETINIIDGSPVNNKADNNSRPYISEDFLNKNLNNYTGLNNNNILNITSFQGRNDRRALRKMLNSGQYGLAFVGNNFLDLEPGKRWSRKDVKNLVNQANSNYASGTGYNVGDEVAVDNSPEQRRVDAYIYNLNLNKNGYKQRVINYDDQNHRYYQDGGNIDYTNDINGIVNVNSKQFKGLFGRWRLRKLLNDNPTANIFTGDLENGLYTSGLYDPDGFSRRDIMALRREAKLNWKKYTPQIRQNAGLTIDMNGNPVLTAKANALLLLGEYFMNQNNTTARWIVPDGSAYKGTYNTYDVPVKQFEDLLQEQIRQYREKTGAKAFSTGYDNLEPDEIILDSGDVIINPRHIEEEFWDRFPLWKEKYKYQQGGTIGLQQSDKDEQLMLAALFGYIGLNPDAILSQEGFTKAIYAVINAYSKAANGDEEEIKTYLNQESTKAGEDLVLKTNLELYKSIKKPGALKLMITGIILLQKQQGIKQAKIGTKLDYIKQLKNICPEGYEIEFRKAGGKVCPVCKKKHKALKALEGNKIEKECKGGISKAMDGIKADIKKVKSNKCGNKIKKHQEGSKMNFKKLIPLYGTYLEGKEFFDKDPNDRTWKDYGSLGLSALGDAVMLTGVGSGVGSLLKAGNIASKIGKTAKASSALGNIIKALSFNTARPAFGYVDDALRTINSVAPYVTKHANKFLNNAYNKDLASNLYNLGVNFINNGLLTGTAAKSQSLVK